MQGELAGNEGFIRNTWYVAGRSEDFGGRLKAMRLLDENVVIFRGAEGEAIALEDACPHRKLPLSKGAIRGSTVECGYHGLTFDATGACVAAPTQPDALPRRARVRSYPVADRWGFLWIWMGEPSLADTAKIIDIPNFDDPGWAVTPRGAMGIACHYLYIIDNLLDPSHVAWVHVTSFAGAGTDNRPLDVEELEDGVIVSRWINGDEPPPYYRPLLPFGPNCDRKQHYECRLPAVALNMSVYTPEGEGGADKPLSENAFVNVSYNFITPVDARNSLYFWFQHRNMLAEDAAVSERMYEGAKTAFQEDREILEEVQSGMEGRTSPYLNLGLDAGAMRFRAQVVKAIEAEASGVMV